MPQSFGMKGRLRMERKDLIEIVKSLLAESGKKLEKNGELAALAGWVNEKFLENFERAINSYFNGAQEAKIKLAWIDKSPLAIIKSGPNKGVNCELADVAVIRQYIDNGEFRDGQLLLLQAKSSNNYKKYYASEDNRDNTKREFSFLASWPEFDLKRWSGSKEKIVESFNVGSQQKDSMGWFAVTAHDPTSVPGKEQDRWLCAPPQVLKLCDINLADVLVHVALQSQLHIDRNGQKSFYELGRTFNAKELSDGGPQNWTDLAFKIIEWSATSCMPPSLSGC